MKRPGKIKVALLTAAFMTNMGIMPVMADTGASPDTTQAAVAAAFNAEAGLTPDNPLYALEKLFEEVQLYLALKAEDKALLLAQFAAERLAEAQALDEAGKKALVVKTVEDYVKTLELAEAQATATVEEGQELEAVLAELQQLCEANIALLEKIKAEVPTLEANLNKVKKKLEIVKAVSGLIKTANEAEGASAQSPGTMKAAQTTAQEQGNVSEETTEATVIIVAQQKELTKELLQQLRSQGWGWGEIAMAAVMAKKAEKNVSDIVALKDKGLGWGEIAKELGIKMRDVAKGLGKWVHEAKDLAKVQVTPQTQTGADASVGQDNDGDDEDDDRDAAKGGNKDKNKDQEKKRVKEEIKAKLKEIHKAKAKAAQKKAEMIKEKIRQFKQHPEKLQELKQALTEFQSEVEKLLGEIQAAEDDRETVQELKKAARELNKELHEALMKHGKKRG